jgi:hypothetical protein
VPGPRGALGSPVVMRSPIIVVTAALAGLLLLAPPASGAANWRWPVHGGVVTVFENDDARPYAAGMHRGIDIAAAVGTTVVAARAGTVTYAGPLGLSGNVVAVRDGAYAVSYLHLGAVSVSRGERVAAGVRVGEVGLTGRRSVAEAHLHFGVRRAGRYVDPLDLLPGAVDRTAQVAVPAGPVVRAEPGLVTHPVRVPVVARLPAAAPERGFPLVLGGLALLALLLFGGMLARLNNTVNRSAVTALRALHDWKVRSGRAQPDH